jgi:hypothetical protein
MGDHCTGIVHQKSPFEIMPLILAPISRVSALNVRYDFIGPGNLETRKAGITVGDRWQDGSALISKQRREAFDP